MSCDECRPFHGVIDRPEVHCAFHVMDRCEANFDEKDAAACREGARDAHLVSEQQRSYHTGAEQRAYETGRYTTLVDCTSPLFLG